jgi:pyridoxal phosphate enzyme (YggS family)
MGKQDSLESRIKLVKERVNAACIVNGRSPNSVTLLAVSKTKPIEMLREAERHGLKQFGENYADEAKEKIQQRPALKSEWHFIGRIQSNKTQTIAQHFAWIHTVDRIKVAKRLASHCPENKILQILLQVNVDSDENKGGIEAGKIDELIKYVLSEPNLNLRGLMTILSKETDPQKGYSKLRDLFNHLQETYAQELHNWDTLSMGMSNDLEVAVNCGATIVRVGTDIFGSRAN